MFGLSMQTIYLLVPLSCLAGAVLAGLLGRPLGRRGAHTVTILGVAVGVATVVALVTAARSARTISLAAAPEAMLHRLLASAGQKGASQEEVLLIKCFSRGFQ